MFLYFNGAYFVFISLFLWGWCPRIFGHPPVHLTACVWWYSEEGTTKTSVGLWWYSEGLGVVAPGLSSSIHSSIPYHYVTLFFPSVLILRYV